MKASTQILFGLLFVLFLTNVLYGQGGESFTNLPTSSSSSYISRSWTGDDGVTWTATDARTDQTINGKAICLGSSGTGYVKSFVYSNGIKTLTFKYVRALSNTSLRSLDVRINNTSIATVTVSNTSDEVQTFSQTINTTGQIEVRIVSTGYQVKIDDISWDSYGSGLQINSVNTLYKIDFDNPFEFVNIDQFNGSGFSSVPSTGKLNSNSWSVTGWSDGDLAFGETHTTANTDYTRGESTGGVTTEGIYAFEVNSGNRALGFQPGDVDWTPGKATLKIRNKTGTTITSFLVCYTIYSRNDMESSSDFNFEHSADDITYTEIASMNFTTPETADEFPSWKANVRTIKIEVISVQNDGVYYLRWKGNDASGTGERDECSLDDIQIVANPAGTKPNFSGTVWNIILDGDVELAGNTAISEDAALTSSTLYVGAKTLSISGSVTRTSGVIDASNSSSLVEFTNTSGLTLPASVFSGNVGNLKMNGTGGVTLGSSTAVGGTLTLTNGKITLGNYNLTAGTLSGGNSSSYIATNGAGLFNMKTGGNTSKTYQIGTVDSYNPAIIKNMGALTNFSVKVKNTFSVYPNDLNKAVQRVWEIYPASSIVKATIELQFNAGEYGTGENTFNPGSTVYIGNYHQNGWRYPVSATITGSGPYVAKAENIKDFSEFGIGNQGAFTIYSQNFDSDWGTTPDGSWTNTPTTGNTSWRRENNGNDASWTSPFAGVVKPYGNTGHSANFHSYGAIASGTGTLDLSVDLSSDANKLLTFDYTNASGTDELKLYLSTNSGTDFTLKGTYATCPWTQQTVDLGNPQTTNCVIRFTATSDYGSNDIGIDNVNIYSGSMYATDAGTVSIDISQTISGTIIPKATVKNFGTSTASFDVTMEINGSTHGSPVSVSNLSPGQSTQVSFSSWGPSAGTYSVEVCTGLTGDLNTLNDCYTKSIEAGSSGNWANGTNSSSTIFLGSGTANATDLYSVGGYTTNESDWGKKTYKYNFSGATWTALPDLPDGAQRTVLATAIAGNYLYAIGGKFGATYYNTVYKYDIVNGGSWSTAATLPQAIGWCKAVTYLNRYIYLAGGHNGANVLDKVYMLDVQAETPAWVELGTTLPGARFGGAFSIAGTKLVYVAGASGNSTLSNTVFVGTINSPTDITWVQTASKYPGNGKNIKISSNENLSEVDYYKILNGNKGTESDEPKSTFPPGSLYGLDAGTWGSSAVIIGGGTSNSSFIPEDPTPFYVYNASSDEWTAMPEIPTPVAGFSMGTANTTGNTWKFLSVSGKTLTGTYTSATQLWTTENITTGYGGTFGILIEGSWSMMKENTSIEVTLELRESTFPYLLAETKTVIQNGTEPVTIEFTNVESTKSYYIVVRYSNGIETWSAQPQLFVNGQMNYDFTTAQTHAYGGNMVKVGELWCIISGDINQDGKINAVDRGICWNDRGTTDEFSDVNHDGIVNELDRTVLAKNTFKKVMCPEGAVVSKNRKNGKSRNKVTK
ncbi:MAG: kelch repeat-containing protein [Candidatus Kapaibacterium sp.]